MTLAWHLCQCRRRGRCPRSECFNDDRLDVDEDDVEATPLQVWRGAGAGASTPAAKKRLASEVTAPILARGRLGRRRPQQARAGRSMKDNVTRRPINPHSVLPGPPLGAAERRDLRGRRGLKLGRDRHLQFTQ